MDSKAVRKSSRYLLFVLWLMATAACILMAWGALRNIWGGTGDSPTSVYILIGALWLLLASGCAFRACRSLRRGRRVLMAAKKQIPRRHK
jgi:hypothetical protein